MPANEPARQGAPATIELTARRLTVLTDHAVGTNPRVVVGVDDEIEIYQKAP